MSEPSEPAEPIKRTRLEKCERHGLHYDPAKMSGCVICRREAGGSLPPPDPQAQGEGEGTEPSAAQGAQWTAPGNRGGGSYAKPLLVAAALCLGVGVALSFLHGVVADSLRFRGGTTEIEGPEISSRQRLQMEQALKELRESGPKPDADWTSDDDQE